MTDLIDDVLEAWGVHNEINLFILDWMPDEGLQAVTLLKTGNPSRGRNVSRIFAHMHAVRCARLDRNYEGAGGLPRFEGSESPSSEQLRDALERSGRAVREVLGVAMREGRPLKGWKRSPVAWAAYLISHESHHRGQIAQALKQSGIRPPQEVSYGTWGYWGGYQLKAPEAG